MGCLILSLLSSASAHEPGLSRVSVDSDQIVLQVARLDSSDPMSLLAGTTASLSDGSACELGPVEVQPDDNGFIATTALRCPSRGEITVRAGWFDQMSPGHRTVLDVGGQPSGFLDAAHPSFTAAADASPAPSRDREIAFEYLSLGVEHILTGWDHLVFLLGLLVVARRLRDIAGVVTGFTLAHSVTLSLAALGVGLCPQRSWSPSSRCPSSGSGSKTCSILRRAGDFCSPSGSGSSTGLGSQVC